MSEQNTNPNRNNHSVDADEISLKNIITKVIDWIKFLQSKLKLIISVTLLGVFIGIFFQKVKEIKYTAVLTFFLDEESNSSGIGGGALGILGLESGSSSGMFSGNNLIELMTSRKIVYQTLLTPITINNKKETLADYYLDINKQQHSNFLEYTNNNPITFQDDSILNKLAIQILKKTVIYQKDKKGNLYVIEITSEDELFSKFFCENLVNNISTFYIETKSKKARRNFELLQKQVDSIRNELNSSIYNLARNEDEIFNLNTALHIKKSKTTTKTIDVQLNNSILISMIPNLQMARNNLMKETPLIQVIDKPLLPLKNTKSSLIFIVFIYGGISAFFISIILLFIKEVIPKILN